MRRRRFATTGSLERSQVSTAKNQCAPQMPAWSCQFDHVVLYQDSVSLRLQRDAAITPFLPSRRPYLIPAVSSVRRVYALSYCLSVCRLACPPSVSLSVFLSSFCAVVSAHHLPVFPASYLPPVCPASYLLPLSALPPICPLVRPISL